jgi:phosphate transport system permease protein
LIDVNETGELLFEIGVEGKGGFFELATGRQVASVAVGHDVAQALPAYPVPGAFALMSADGDLSFVQTEYVVDFVDGDRQLTPGINVLFEAEPIALGKRTPFDVWLGDDELTVARLDGNRLEILHWRDADHEFALESPRRRTVALERRYERIIMGPMGRWLYLVDPDGVVALYEMRRAPDARPVAETRLVPAGSAPPVVEPLLGRYSLLVGDEQGLTQWLLVRAGEGHVFENARSFAVDQPIVRILPEHRRKGFVAVDATGAIHLGHATSGEIVASIEPGTLDPREANLAIAPRGNRLLMVAPDGRAESIEIDNAHPEISLSTLWRPVWYEGYSQPVYSWQSSSADTEFEPKFSFVPLFFGTLKAAFYAMLFAAPIAILGALYTAYFMAPGMRRLVKPGIEIMAALPTVVLGFLAGLWLAPAIEAHLAPTLLSVLAVPIVLIAFAWSARALPEVVSRAIDGWYGLVVLVPIAATVWIVFAFGAELEQSLFGGDTRKWLLDVFGLEYDQRNALVVGIAMGLAVIPTIFSIAEDAVYGVPRHLINGSLALGATTWQTLTRVVILTASPGIFSAVMIGLGRAVGETMIVLMATGNTPVMDFDLFSGMRTFAANLAVELPESEVGSSHYRILFLTALVLFLITFAFNTAAEVVRQRLRERYGSL